MATDCALKATINRYKAPGKNGEVEVEWRKGRGRVVSSTSKVSGDLGEWSLFRSRRVKMVPCTCKDRGPFFKHPTHHDSQPAQSNPTHESDMVT